MIAALISTIIVLIMLLCIVIRKYKRIQRLKDLWRNDYMACLTELNKIKEKS